MMWIPIIMLVILGGFGLVFVVVNKKQQKDSSTNKSGNEKSKNDAKKGKDAIIPKEDVFKFMEFDKILDNMIIQNNGSRFTMMIQCKGINYDLMSDVEQLSIEEGFITFLNTLRYPIQLYVQAQNLDLKGTIKVYKDNISHIKEDFENINEEYNKVNEAFDSTKEEIKQVETERNKVLNVYEYASDIVNYVERISLNKSLLQRSFYVLVSYNSSEITSTEGFSKDEILNICYNELVTRAQSIISGLGACSVSGRILDSNEIADVLYTAYNRDDKGLMSVKEALESGFYRLYSTTEDIFLKKQNKLQEEIENEAKIKAIEAIKKSLQDGEYISPRIEQLDVEEQISKKASEIVRRENVPIDIKSKANEILIEEYRNTKKEILEKAAEEQIVLRETLDIGTDENKEDNTLVDNKKEEKRIDVKEKEEDKNTVEIKEQKNDTKEIPQESKIEEREEPKIIVKRKELDKRDFEFNDRLGDMSDSRLTNEFDDRLGTSNYGDDTESSGEDLIV